MCFCMCVCACVHSCVLCVLLVMYTFIGAPRTSSWTWDHGLAPYLLDRDGVNALYSSHKYSITTDTCSMATNINTLL